MKPSDPHGPGQTTPLHPPGDMTSDAGASYKPSGTHPTLFPSQVRDGTSEGPGGTIAIDDMDSIVDSDDPHEIAASLEDRTAMGFSLLRLVGKGGMGEVWEGVQRRLRRIVAVKKLRLGGGALPFTESNTQLRSFRGEALTAALLDHPNIVPVYDLGFDEEGWPLLAMKFVKGQNWDEILKRDFDAIPAEDYLARHIPILAQVAQAVAFAHSKGVIHRDLKPSQVMIGEYGEVLLMDWGLALMVGDPPAVNGEPPPPRTYPSVNSAANPAGTPGFMAPEQTSNSASELGVWTDVYLLGGTLYKILTGRMPHDAPNSEQAFALAAAGAYRPIPEAAGDRPLPRELVEITTESLAAEPARRIASAKLFLDRLQDFLTGASRRRESTLITSDVAATPGLDHTMDYGELTEAISRIGQADRLWPENPQVPVQRARLVERYARAALGHGDLTLARAQAASLPEGPARSAILASVESEHERLRVQRLRVRQLTVAAFALLAGIVVIGTVSSSRLQESAERLRGQLALTEEARTAEVVARGEAQAEADYSTLLLANALVDQQRNDEAIALLERIPEAKRTWEWGLVLTRALSDLAQIPVEYIAFSPSRELAIAYRASDDKMLVVRASDGRVVSILPIPRPENPRVAWSVDEGRLAVLPVNARSFSACDTRTGARLAGIEAEGGESITAADISADGSMLAVGTSSGTVRLVSLDDSHAVRELKPHALRVDRIHFAADPDLLVTVSRASTRLESLSTGQVSLERPVHTPVERFSESDPTRRYVGVYARGGDAFILDTEEGATLDIPADLIDLEFSRQAPVMLASTRSEISSVRVWNLSEWREVHPAVYPHGPDGAPREWAAPDVGESIQVMLNHDETAVVLREAFAYSSYPYPSMLPNEHSRTTFPRSDFTMELAKDSPAAWFSTRDSGTTRLRQPHRQYVGRTVNGRSPGMGSDLGYYTLIRRGRVESRDAETGRLICVAAEGYNWYRGTRPSPDGTETIAFGRRDRTFTVEKSSRATSELSSRFEWEEEPYDFSGSPDATKIFLIAEDQSRLSIWSLSDKSLMGEDLADRGVRITSAAFSPDSGRIAVGSSDGSVRVIDGGTGALLKNCDRGSSTVRRLAWAPDGETIGGTLQDGGVVCWDPQGGRIKQRMRMPAEPAFLLWFAPDGNLLLAQPEQGSGVLWNWREGKLHAQLGLAGFLVDNVRFLPGGHRIVAWAGGECRVWDAHTGREVFSTDRDFGTISADAHRVMLREGEAQWTMVEVIPWKTADLPGDPSMTWRERVGIWTRERHRKWYIDAPLDRIPEQMELLRVESWRRIGHESDRLLWFLSDAAVDLTLRGNSLEARRLLLNIFARTWRARPADARFGDPAKTVTMVGSYLNDDRGAANEPIGHMFVSFWATTMDLMLRPDNASAFDIQERDLPAALHLMCEVLRARGDDRTALQAARAEAAFRLIIGQPIDEVQAVIGELGGGMPPPPDPALVIRQGRIPVLVEGIEGGSGSAGAKSSPAWGAWRSAVREYLLSSSGNLDWAALAEKERTDPSFGPSIDPESPFAKAFPTIEEELQRCLFDGMTLAEKQEELGREFDRRYVD